MLQESINVERRKDRRKVVSNPGPVYFYFRGKRVHKGYTRDITTRGVFISIKHMSIPLGAVTQLAFTVETADGIVRVHRKSAVITRIADDGVGVGFIRSQTRR